MPLLIAKQAILLTNYSLETLYKISFVIFANYLFFSILKYLISYHAQKFFTTTYKNLHLDIMAQFFNTSYQKIEQKSCGYYIQRLTDDTIDISDFFLNVTDNLIDILINIGSLITLFLLNKLIFLFYLYFLLLTYFIKKEKNKRYLEEEIRKRQNVEILMTSNIEAIENIKEIKLLNAKNFFLKKTEKKLNDFNSSTFSLGEVNRFFLFLTNNVHNVFRLLLISLTIYLIANNKLTLSIALLAINYENDIFKLLNNIEEIQKNWKIYKLSCKRIQEIIQDETFGKEKKMSNIPSIDIKNLSFSYSKDNIILKNINLKIEPKEHIAIVGKSASGKTTLFHILTKLYYVPYNKIKIGEYDLNDLQEDTLRNTISVVSQETKLFQMSILDNLKLNKRNITEKEIIEACKIAQIHEDILSLPNGYSTILNTNGFNLSGGQRQRLAIARAILKKAPIILFDEATSALDNETQEKVQIALKRITSSTIITIAHRLSTIIDNDRIIFLNHGKIEQIGTHQELLKTNLNYQKLYQLENQKSNYELNPKSWTV